LEGVEATKLLVELLPETTHPPQRRRSNQFVRERQDDRDLLPDGATLRLGVKPELSRCDSSRAGIRR
jgi:hypothetical protein